MSVPATSSALLDQLPAHVRGDGPSWLVGLRESGAAALRETGFPHRKVESWRFTSVRSLTGVAFVAPPSQDIDVASAECARQLGEAAAKSPALRVLMVDGRPVIRGAVPAGIEILSLADAIAQRPAWLRQHLGTLVKSEYFAAMNAAVLGDGVVVHVTARAAVEQPIHVVHVAGAGAAPSVSYPRVLIVADEASSARVAELYLAHAGEKNLTSAVTEVFVGPGAHLDHARVLLGNDTSYHVAKLAVRQDRASVYASHVATLGGRLSRLEIDVLLDGEGADCTLDGMYHVDGRDHVDHQTRIEHAKPRCTSNETYRGIADGAGQAVFNGIVVVGRDAPGTVAHQQNRNLLLSDDAGVHTKPHLEIDTDDVVCSHGATIGALDETQLFYLRSRGVGERTARAALTYAFVQSMVERIPDEALARRIGELIRARLPEGDTVSELLS